jgi:hypothetical protein
MRIKISLPFTGFTIGNLPLFSNRDVGGASRLSSPVKSALLYAAIIISVATAAASADVVCVKRSQPVTASQVRLNAAVKVVNTACPRGFIQLLDTSSLEGSKGSDGKGALVPENCASRRVTHTVVNTNTERGSYTKDSTCNPGEFAHSSISLESTYTYSADWNYDGDASAAGATLRVGPIEGSPLSTVSSSGLPNGVRHQVGGQHVKPNGSMPDDLADATSITGSVTTTSVYTLLCCSMSEY